MEFDWEKFLRSEFPNGKIVKGKNNKRELNIDCISPNCPNPHEHMFVNINSDNPRHHKKFICHRCGIKGNYKAFLVNYFKLSIEDILENISDIHGFDEDPFTSTKSLVKQSKETLSLSKSVDDEEGFIIELPKEYKKLVEPIKFCKKRKIPFKIFKKFKAGICKSGFYKGRLIFPVITSNNSSFLAYSQLSKKSIERWKILSRENSNNKLFKKNSRKVLYPLGSLINLLLFNYNHVQKNEKIIFVVEGLFDCARILLHGYAAVAYLKGFVSEYQAQLLSDKNPDEICFIPDSDVNRKSFNENLKVLIENCDCDVSSIKLKTGDPDDIISKSKFNKIIKKRLYGMNLDSFNKPLKLF